MTEEEDPAHIVPKKNPPIKSDLITTIFGISKALGGLEEAVSTNKKNIEKIGNRQWWVLGSVVVLGVLAVYVATL